VNGNLWRAVVPRLADRFRCIVPDWPLGSHEQPMRPTADLTPPGIAETIVRFADALSLEDVTLVANDTGGAISQMAVARHPGRFARLVLTNGDAFENFLPLRYRYLSWAAHVPGALALLAQSLRLSLVRRMPIAYGPLTTRPIPADIAVTYVRPAADSAAVRENLGKTLRAISTKDTMAAADGLRRFRGRLLLVWSDDDPIFPLDYARRLAALAPNSTLEVIHGSRCFVPEDQPDVLADKIRAFLDAAPRQGQGEPPSKGSGRAQGNQASA
jgi:pimeloyl-ACP methyl ester carboxylesterase